MTPLALEMLIWFCTRGFPAAGKFENADRGPQHEIITGFLRDGIIMASPDGIEGIYEATDKGRAWLEMLASTPQPVQQWVDPRDGLGLITGLEGRTVTALADGLTPRQRAQRDRRAKEKNPLIEAGGPVRGGGDFVVHTVGVFEPSMPTIPPGFTAWDGSAAAPPGMRSDQPVEVMRRNGKIVSKVGGDQLYAVSVNWRNNGKPDDTIAYRLTTDPLDMEE